MPKQELTELVVILDRSGSMSSMKADVEGGFATLLADQRALPGECRLTLVQFDSMGIDTVHEARPVGDVPPLVLEPRGSTPLLDAIGQTITNTGKRLAGTAEAERPARVMVVIITDGQENASRTYTRPQIRDMVEHQQKAYAWHFTFLGANLDGFAEGQSLGAGAAASATYTPSTAKAAMSVVSASVGRYRSGGSADFTAAEVKTMNPHTGA